MAADQGWVWSGGGCTVSKIAVTFQSCEKAQLAAWPPLCIWPQTRNASHPYNGNKLAGRAVLRAFWFVIHKILCNFFFLSLTHAQVMFIFNRCAAYGSACLFERSLCWVNCSLHLSLMSPSLRLYTVNAHLCTLSARRAAAPLKLHGSPPGQDPRPQDCHS